MKIKSLLLVLVVMVMSGCTRIHFDNGEVTPQLKNMQTNEQWHHNVALALYEASEPVDLKGHCKQKEWQSVTTERSLINVLAGTAVNFIAPIWYPKTVTVTCQNVTVPYQN